MMDVVAAVFEVSLTEVKLQLIVTHAHTPTPHLISLFGFGISKENSSLVPQQTTRLAGGLDSIS